jgi:hypothetical protein
VPEVFFHPLRGLRPDRQEPVLFALALAHQQHPLLHPCFTAPAAIKERSDKG